MVDPVEYFVAGGTLRTQAPSYVVRPADADLLRSLLAGEFCYVLTPRQMGKSSLMVRTAQQLREQGVRTVIIDLTSIGTVSGDEWYLGLLSRMRSGLRLATDVQAWWQTRGLSLAQRFTTFLREVVLAEVTEDVVVFIDEIDSTLNLDFRDDFFAAIRAVYNARASEPRFARITFALLGVATPTELIQDRKRTPFNIGHRIDLKEFSPADAQPLAAGLEALFPGQAATLFGRILYWTNGHPYLTQKLCLEAARRTDAYWDDAAVDSLVAHVFLSDEGRKDTNLTFIQDRIISSPPADRRAMLRLYRQVFQGRRLRDDDRSIVQNRLELFGLVHVVDGELRVRNAIYRLVFNDAWISAAMPADPQRRVAIAAVVTALLVVAGSVLFILTRPDPRCDLLVDQFRQTDDASLRLNALARLFAQGNRCSAPALDLFYTLTPEEQESIFRDVQPNATNRADLTEAIQGVYVTLDTMPDAQDQRILAAMLFALQHLGIAKEDPLYREIEHWRAGRVAAAAGDFATAATEYAAAIETRGDHQVVRFDHAVALAELKDFAGALVDLDVAIGIVLAAATPVPTATAAPSLSPTQGSALPAAPIDATNAITAPANPVVGDVSITATLSATVAISPTQAQSSQAAPAFESRFRTADSTRKAIRDLLLRRPALVGALNARQPGSLANLARARLVEGIECFDIVEAGDFETPTFPNWAPQGNVVADSSIKIAGAFAARLGLTASDPNQRVTSQIVQRIFVPDGFEQTRLAFDYLYKFDLDIPDGDLQSVYVNGPDGERVPVLLGTKANSVAWSSLADFSLDRFAGQEVELEFGVDNDGAGGRTWMYIDNVVVQSCLRPAPPIATQAVTQTATQTGTQIGLQATVITATSGAQEAFTLRLPAGPLSTLTLDFDLGGDGPQDISFAVDIGADRATDWSYTGSTTLPVRFRTGNMAAAVNPYLTGVSGMIDIPMRIEVIPSVPVTYQVATTAPAATSTAAFNPKVTPESTPALEVALVQIGPDSMSPIVTDALVFEVIAYDPAVGADNGAGINLVEMSVLDASGQEVHLRSERNAGYCAFGGGEPVCNTLNFAEAGNLWPTGAPIVAGAHTLRAVIVAASGITTTLEQVIDLQALTADGDAAVYIRDADAFPDGALVAPRQSFTKEWVLRNAGTTTWGRGYQLERIDGQAMGAPATIAVPVTPPGAEVTLAATFIAPIALGAYTSAWRLTSRDGTLFGPTIWARVEVPVLTVPDVSQQNLP